MDKLKFSQFGVMSVNYQLYSLEYALASIAKAGFRYVDLWGGAPHYSYFDTAPGQRDRRIGEIRRMLDDNGLKVSVFTAEQICLYPINVASSNPYVRRNSLEIVKGYLEDTKALDAIYFFPQMGYCLFDEDEAAAYDRSIESLREKSRRPHHHPNQHTEQELKLIRDMRRRNPAAGLVVLWVKLRQRGYTRTVTGLYRVLRRSGGMVVKPKNPKYIPKPYEQMSYPGERVQIDVKFVPAACLVGAAAGRKFYQYTAIDEFSRYRYLEAFEENSTYSSTQFLIHMLDHFKRLGFSVKCVQTDNGFEFTKRFGASAPDNLSLFERALKERKITHKLIRPFTPRHNGKVERSHRKDNEYFYATHTFYSFNDFKKQLAVHLRKYNNFPMRPLNWISPKATLNNFLKHNVTYH